MDFAEIASFKGYGFLYLIHTATYMYTKYCSYPNDDTETVTIDRTVMLAMLHDGLSCGGKILVNVHDWLKHGFRNTRKQTLRRLVFIG